MYKEKIKKYIGTKELSVMDAMCMIDNNGKGLIYIVDENETLIGSLTDGDIRRWILREGNLSGTAEQMVFRNTKFLYEYQADKCMEFMEAEGITSVPIIDISKKIVDIRFKNEHSIIYTKERKNALKQIPVIVMAGGKGTRLYPYTKILPKPLIPIGDIPILERILVRFYEHGADEFYLTVNYKKEMIKSYFIEQCPPYTIHYVEETKPLGTAGSIRLIKKTFHTPVIITNCDTLIDMDYKKILAYHSESCNKMTIVSSLKNTAIPYGVLHSKEQGIITSMEEKPQLSYFINTGMYIINPEYLQWIPENTFYHMTDLANDMIHAGEQVGMYPISENSFLDMGEFEEMKKMEERINRGVMN